MLPHALTCIANAQRARLQRRRVRSARVAAQRVRQVQGPTSVSQPIHPLIVHR
jgi:hypothetical protein